MKLLKLRVDYFLKLLDQVIISHSSCLDTRIFLGVEGEFNGLSGIVWEDIFLIKGLYDLIDGC